MKYYVVSDVHGYFSILKKVLEEKGFFNDTEPHKLIICGDAFDRGTEAVEMERFMHDLYKKDELIYIKGNHESLYQELVDNFEDEVWKCMTRMSHHYSNGTYDTAIQLARFNNMTSDKRYLSEALTYATDIRKKLQTGILYKKLMPAMVDYFETEHYIFVHGWIPCVYDDMPVWYQKGRRIKYDENWRTTDAKYWEIARWMNGIDMAMKYKMIEDKTIICGHWHASYGHMRYHHTCSEFGEDAIFEPFEDKGIIAIDACTAHTGKINCLVIED